MSQGDSKQPYLGRQARRGSSEQRRLSILHATLRIVAKEGVRAVRHRAVAKEANVPLSATTYYFKDIHDLLTDAFVLYAQEMKDDFLDPFWRESLCEIDRANDEQHGQQRIHQVMDAVSRQVTLYILKTVKDRREHLMMEFAFLYAALQDEHLHQSALTHMDNLLMYMRHCMEIVGARSIDTAAKSLQALIRRVQYEAMLGQQDALDEHFLHQMFIKQLEGSCLHVV